MRAFVFRAQSPLPVILCFQAFGQYGRAEQLFEAASRIHRRALGDAHPHNIAALNNLALLYQAKGDTAKEKVMRMLAKALQEPPPGA